jgi:glutathione S-transferase
MRLYDHPASANCMKTRILLRQLEVEYEPVLVDLFAGETRQAEHLARNPDGRVPVLETDDGDLIPESAAILLYLAEGTGFLPGDRLARARVHQWLFFEQNQVEAGVAVARFMALYGGLAAQHPEVFANRQAQGRRSLKTLARALADGRPFIASDDYTVADIALYAYVHCAGDAGLELDPRIQTWLARVEATAGFVNDLAPMPASEA